MEKKALTEAKKEKKQNPKQEHDENEVIVRIFGQDVLGSKNIYTAMTKIKGVSWAISNAVCINLGLNRATKVIELSKDDIKKIEHELKHVRVPTFMKNRRLDLDSGEDLHLLTTELDIKKEFDIKRLKKIKSYRGIRHSLGLPVRGQRTRSHFRSKGGATGVKKKQDAPKA